MAIDTKGAAWSEHSTLYALPKALLGGTAAMRQAGQLYLSKGSAEPQGDYDYRLANTFLTDSYKRTLNYLTGQVMKKAPVLDQAASADVVAWSEDVDRKGNNLAVFAQKAFRAGLDAGVVFMAFDHSGEPRHVGIVVGGGEFILHSRKTRVQCDRMGVMRTHRLEFYRHVDNRHPAQEDSPTARHI